jgi:predicted nucleic acid-binding protein
MILVDTSVWVDHLQRGNADLAEQLTQGRVLTHPFVVGELALGSLQQRAQVLESLQNLPMTAVATDTEVLNFIRTHTLHGMGIGYVDAHLLAAARLSPGARLWTLDKRLQAAASPLGLAFSINTDTKH